MTAAWKAGADKVRRVAHNGLAQHVWCLARRSRFLPHHASGRHACYAATRRHVPLR